MDNKTDLITANSQNDNMSIFINTSNGFIEELLTDNADNVYPVVDVDLDNDGDIDILTAYNSVIYWFENLIIDN